MTGAVKPGQLWGGYWKDSNRRLRVTEVDSRYVYAESWWEDRQGLSRSVRILLGRFTDLYRLIEDVTE